MAITRLAAGLLLAVLLAGCGGQAPGVEVAGAPAHTDTIGEAAKATVNAVLTQSAAPTDVQGPGAPGPVSGDGTDDATTATATSTPSATLVESDVPSATPLPIVTPQPTATPAPSATPTPSATPLPPPTADLAATQTAQAQQVAEAVAATLAVQATTTALEHTMATAIAATLTAQAPPPPTPTPTFTATPRPTFTPTFTTSPTPTPVPPAASLLLAYVYGDVGDSDIQIYDPANGRTWTVADRACDEAEPDWMPDGRSIVYQADCDGSYELYAADVQTRSVRRLTSTSGQDEREPDVSPDGGWIVYRTNREQNARNVDGSLEVLNLRGGDPQALGISGRSPSWSPDGKEILFMSERDAGWEVYVYSLDDGSTRRLTNCSPNCRFPAWSPDGQWVVYHSTTGPNTADAETIWRVAAGGGEPEMVVTGSGAGRPTWSADGLIAFNSQRGIEAVDARGQQRRTLLQDNSHWAPAWSR